MDHAAAALDPRDLEREFSIDPSLFPDSPSLTEDATPTSARPIVVGDHSTLPPSVTHAHLQNQTQNDPQNDQKPNLQNQTPVPKFAPTTYPSYLRGMLPRIQNMIATINTGCVLDLRTIALGTRNAEYNPKRFSGVIVRIREPKTTALIFGSGKIVCAGARSETDCLLAMKKFVLILQRLGFKEASLGSFKIHNVVGCSDVRFPIRLEALASEHSQFCTYEPELFPGLVFRMMAPRVCVIVFVSGKIVLTGGKSKQELNQAFLNIYPVLVGFCKDNYKGQVMSRGPPPEKPSFLTKTAAHLP